MQYADIRPVIRNGDILAWSHRGIKSWRDLKTAVIRLVTRSEYVHTGTAWVIGDRVFVIEAVQPLVRIYPLSKLLANGCYWIPMHAPWKDSTLECALSYVGNVYSQVQAMESVFHLPPEDNAWECAELTRTIAMMDGIDLGNVATPAAIVQAALHRNSILYSIDPQV